MTDVIVGIDLGTTNSEVAVIQDGQPFVIPGDDGDPILPSFVGMTEDEKLLVGQPARNQWVLAPDRTVKSIKRKMGQDVKVAIGSKEFRPQEISAMILRALRDRASKFLGTEVAKAVITVPAYFNDAQRQATIEAGHLAGLDVLRIINEPTAAALIYDPRQVEGMRVLVYDLGGGTFDVSIVHTEHGVVEVLASHGDTQLGGDDFDELLLNNVCDRFKTEHGIDLRDDRTSRARILRAVEAAKKQLSDHAFARIEEEFVAEKDGIALHMSMEVNRIDYELMIRPLIDRTMDCVKRSLDDAKLTPREIDRVVLVGGSTRTPLIGELIEERMQKPAHREINPDLCVAMGAAVQAAIIGGLQVGSVLVDITPHSLGIKCLDSSGMSFAFGQPVFRFAPIIRRGTPLPASRSEMFQTACDNQEQVEIDIYQGEHEDVQRNHAVGMFVVEGLAKRPAGNLIVVQLDLTLDGVLKVAAKEKATGLQKHITIDNALARFGREEREAASSRLEELWQQSFEEEPTDDDEEEEPPGFIESTGQSSSSIPILESGPREGQREGVQARALLEKAERLCVNSAPEDRKEIERLMQNVRIALQDRNWPDVDAAVNALADVLFYLEDA